MYEFKLVKKNCEFDETRFSTDNVELALYVADSMDAELYYWTGNVWKKIDDDFIAFHADHVPFGREIPWARYNF